MVTTDTACAQRTPSLSTHYLVTKKKETVPFWMGHIASCFESQLALPGSL